MTTIAYKNGVMASDTRVTAKEFIFPGHSKKIFRMAEGLVGIAGDADQRISDNENFYTLTDYGMLSDWLESLEHPDAEWELLIVFKDEPQTIYFAECKMEGDASKSYYWSMTLDPDQGFAIGSGSYAANAVMGAGVSAQGAVSEAMKHDACTGGKVVTCVL